MHRFWIVVANAGRACVYRKAQGATGLELVHQLEDASEKDFAHELCGLLETAANRQSYDELVLFAPAHLLGLLRAGLSSATKKLPISTLAKDLTQLTQSDLENRLSDLLQFHAVGSATASG
jgi:hypothetical protein